MNILDIQISRVHGFRYCIVLLMLAIVSSCSKPYQTHDLNIRNHVFKVELALTSRQRSRGLMYREQIPENGGMLFVYKTPREHHYWMKNCLVDMDLALIDSSGTVVALHEMKAEPLQTSTESEEDYNKRLKIYPSRVSVIFALELQAGAIKKLGLSIGEQLVIPIADLQALAE